MKKMLSQLMTITHMGSKKLILLLREQISLIEVKILLTGLILAIGLGVYLGYLFFADFNSYKIMSSAAMLNIMGGRSLGIAVCLSANISPAVTMSYNFFLETMTVLITYSIFVLIMRDVIQPKLFKHAVRQAELAAERQKTRIKRYGAIGLFLFVIFPFFMTGPVIGALIGYLLNYRPAVNFLIVLCATLTSIVFYTLMGNQAIQYIEQFFNIDLLKKWTAIISLALIVIFLIYHMKTIKKYLNGLDDD